MLNNLDDLLAAQPAVLFAALPVPGGMSAAYWVVVGGAGNLAREFFERLSLGLGDEEGGEDTAQHEEGENLHDMVKPWGCVRTWGSTFCSKGAKDDLGDDGTDLA